MDTDVKVIEVEKFVLYNKLSYARILIGSHDLLEDRRIDDIIIKNFFNSLLYQANRFHASVQ